MKSLTTLMVCSMTALSVSAQYNYNTVTINYNGQNKQVMIDGRAYTPTTTGQYAGQTTSGYNLQVVATDLAPGTHSLTISKNNNNRRETQRDFILRNNYDLTVSVANNGSVQLKETYRKRGNTGSTTTTGNIPMPNSNYNALYADVRRRSASARINVLSQAFAGTSNYFTTAQAKKLIQLVNGESFRLQLAKESVRSITDTRNIYGLSSVLASTAGRNELAEYIRTYNSGQVTVPPVYGVTAMSNANFSQVYNDMRNRWQGDRLTAITNVFSTSNYYFSTNQAIQLIQLVSTESERLQLAKASYHTIVDPANFGQVSNLLGTQASRNDLALFIRNGGTGSYTPSTTFNTAMSESAFNSLYNQIRGQWLPGAKKSAVLNAFANTSNYFTSYQAAQLVQLDNDEPDRMDMAKASLRSIVDPENLAQLYNVFPSQARRDELAAYVSANSTYGTSGNTGTSTSYRTPMTDANFATLLDETRRMWLPGAKKSAVLNAFNTSGNYFTTNQAMQLIQLDNDEPDRLDMAKASYRTVVDPQNFSQVYGLFTSQSYKNDLALYVRSIQ